MNDFEYQSETENLPSRREYHRRKKKKKDDNKKEKRNPLYNPFLWARMLLAFFLVLVLFMLSYSMFF